MEEDGEYVPTETWRTRDERFNMIRVGEALAQALTAQGFSVTHDTTAFEPPNLSTAYTRSLAMLEERLAAGEHYDYIFDVHRDAYSGLYNGANCAPDQSGPAAYVCCWWARARGTAQLTSGPIGQRTRAGAGSDGCVNAMRPA